MWSPRQLQLAKNPLQLPDRLQLEEQLEEHLELLRLEEQLELLQLVVQQIGPQLRLDRLQQLQGRQSQLQAMGRHQLQLQQRQHLQLLDPQLQHPKQLQRPVCRNAPAASTLMVDLSSTW